MGYILTYNTIVINNRGPQDKVIISRHDHDINVVDYKMYNLDRSSVRILADVFSVQKIDPMSKEIVPDLVTEGEYVYIKRD